MELVDLDFVDRAIGGPKGSFCRYEVLGNFTRRVRTEVCVIGGPVFGRQEVIRICPLLRVDVPVDWSVRFAGIFCDNSFYPTETDMLASVSSTIGELQGPLRVGPSRFVALTKAVVEGASLLFRKCYPGTWEEHRLDPEAVPLQIYTFFENILPLQGTLVILRLDGCLDGRGPY